MQREPQRRRVTVIEDSPGLLELLGDVLRFDGLDVSLLDGETTLDDIQASQPELLVIDWRLSTNDLTGLDIIRHARSEPALRDVPIIVCSGAPDEVGAHEDELAGTPQVSMLPKPFSLDELEASVRQALSSALTQGSAARQ